MSALRPSRVTWLLIGLCTTGASGLLSHPPARTLSRLARAPRTRLLLPKDEDLRPGSLLAATIELGTVPYGEESRRYRRTIFHHRDWVKHRSPKRLLVHLQGTLVSGVVRNLAVEVGLVVAVALFVIVWNAALFGYEDFGDVHHISPLVTLCGASSVPDWLHLRLPTLPFSLSSSALGLLLVFRTNTSYARWLEARKAWGRIVAHSRNILRQSCVWMESCSDEERKERLGEVGLAVWLFARSLQVELLGPDSEAVFMNELRAFMSEECVQRWQSAPNRPLRTLYELSDVMNRLPIDEKRRVEMDKSVILIGDASEACERIFSSPVPLVYTRHTARFLSTYLLLLPLGMYDAFEKSWNHLALLPAMALLAIFLFGIEELAVQLEEPFSILPLDNLCEGIRAATVDAQNMWSKSRIMDENVKKDIDSIVGDVSIVET